MKVYPRVLRCWGKLKLARNHLLVRWNKPADILFGPDRGSRQEKHYLESEKKRLPRQNISSNKIRRQGLENNQIGKDNQPLSQINHLTARITALK